MIIDAAVYRDGKRASDRCSLKEVRHLLATVEGENDFVWIGLHEPTAAELDEIGELFGLHRLAIEDVSEPHQRPKMEKYKDHFFIVLKTLSYHDDQVETGEIDAFLGPNYFITVRNGNHSIKDVRARAEERLFFLDHGPAAALYAVVDGVVDQYEAVADELQTDVEEVEASVFSDGRTRDSDRIYALKREMLECRRAILPLKAPTGRLLRGDFDFIPERAMPFYRDVADHLARVADDIDAADHLLDNALNGHLARLSLQQNDDMRKLAAYAAMFAAPTLIAGVYGMNFEKMPELTYPYGYPLCLLAMVAVVAWLYWSFKRSGWL
ncbi:magnesium/cobalt transporter CorA [Solicola sp. PLA-1-18]|uniref:magnesium/cobalt transporter CorA n=1 Tax=Solicola sp. PLA-1-18 TaxID=3380532 RepID=UPI003B81A0FD